jgi:hypothetical protein
MQGTAIAGLLSGITPRESGFIMAEFLKAEPGPATELFQGLAQAELHIEVAPEDVGPYKLTQKERYRLDADLYESAWRRVGCLVTPGGITVVNTTLIWMPYRLPWSIRARLRSSDEPCGTILGPLGLTRIDRRALAIEDRDGSVVTSSAVLDLNDTLVGIAEERVMWALCLMATARPGRLPKRPTGAVCKTVGIACGGSNPPPATSHRFVARPGPMPWSGPGLGLVPDGP